jgi:hypothetical protein
MSDSGSPKVEITARVVLDRRAVAVLDLELRRLARQLGLEVAAVRIRRLAAEATSAS